jgi:hypothetical protein
VVTELRCDYCSQVFRLQDGGASFEGKAACVSCEQHLNRDVVLPTMGKNRPTLVEQCEVAGDRSETQKPTWAGPMPFPPPQAQDEEECDLVSLAN